MDELMNRLKSINVDKRIEQIEKELKETKDPRNLNSLVKEYKILTNIKDLGISPYEAFTRETIPVIPSQYRSPIEVSDNSLFVPDINEQLKNIGLANEALKDAKENNLPYEDIKRAKKELYLLSEDLMGFDTPKNNKFKVNYWAQISPDNKSPKQGFFQSNVIRKRNDLTGRSVISPNPNLDMDQIEMPIDMGLVKYKPFIAKELIQRGYSKDQAFKLIESKDDKAIEILHKLGKEIPVVINRAPSIWKGSTTAHYPIFVDKQNISIPNVVAQSQLGDFDGDSVISNVKVITCGFRNLVIFFLDSFCSRFIFSHK